ncbi:MAG: hypothetical protein GF346_13455, partial [Candidatus Eisenbacteria bacterium]|nr:hypothetical protein [Candidatus Latescibacterota bacterium]MBD3303447.1 hypothetical protein [Candidatus Eisenbacteria bacterium]
MAGGAQRPDGAGSGPRRTGTPIGLPAPEELSGQPWVGEAAVEVLRVLTGWIRERCAPFTPLSLFLGGSAVHGELCGIADPAGARWFLSDLDLGLVTERLVPPREQAVIREEAIRLPGEGPAVTIGFYTPDRLAGQDPTLGMVETARCGFRLEGALDPFR